MAIAGTCVWEIQPTGSNGAADTNGGGYDSAIAGGADLSQAAPVAVTGLAAAQNSTTVTGTGFDTVHWPGNIIYISGGTNFVADWYEITAVASATSMTLDRAPATAGAGSAGTGNVGGPLASPGQMGNIVSSSTRCSAGQTVFLKNNGSTIYSIGAGTANTAGNGVSLATVAGVAATPHTWVGYSTSRTINNSDTGPTLQCGAASVTILTLGVINAVVRNLTFDGNLQTSSKLISVSNSVCRIANCTLKNALLGAIAAATKFPLVEDCYITGCTTTAAVAGGPVLARCEFNANTAGHVSFTGASGSAQDCIFRGNGAGVDNITYNIGNATLLLINNTIDAGRHGLNITAQNSQALVVNCLFSNNGGYGVTASAAMGGVFVRNCAFFNETSGQVNTGAAAIPAGNVAGSISLTGTPYNNLAGGDLSLNAFVSQGGGARGAGIPGIMPAGTTTGYIDIGAMQHKDPVSVGGRVVDVGGGGVAA